MQIGKKVNHKFTKHLEFKVKILNLFSRSAIGEKISLQVISQITAIQ